MNKDFVLGLGKIPTIFINPYTACNNNCNYCCIGNTNDLDFRIKLSVLKHHTEKTIEFIKLILNDLEDNCLFIFLGGEPLLTWNSWILPTIKSLIEINPHFQFKFSTNGTLLTPDKYEDISRYNIDINLSLDGPKEVHDLNRKLWSGEGSFDLIYHNILQIPRELAHHINPCSTIHINTAQYFSKTFSFMKDLHNEVPFNYFTTGITDGYQWTKDHFQILQKELYKVKAMMPVPFGTSFIPNAPTTQSLIINFRTGLVTVKSNELSNPINTIIANITKEDGMIFEDRLKQYQQIHLYKQEKRLLPHTDLCNICPGKDTYCIQKEKDFFKDEQTYINLTNFCQHNYILNTVFEGGFYESTRIYGNNCNQTN